MAGWLIPAMYGAQAVGGAISASGDLAAAKAMRDAMSGQLDANQALAQGNYDYATGQWQPYANAGTQALTGLQNWSSPTAGQFDYNKSVQSFLDPSIQYQQDQARQQIEGAAGPVGLSGSALRSLNQRATNIAGQGYANAVGWQQNDKNFAYQQFLNDFNARRTQALDQYNQLQSLLSTGTNATGQLVNAKNAFTGQQGAINEQRGQLQGEVNAARASFMPKMIGGMLGNAGQALGAYQGAQDAQAWYDMFKPQQAGVAPTLENSRMPIPQYQAQQTQQNPYPTSWGSGPTADGSNPYYGSSEQQGNAYTTIPQSSPMLGNSRMPLPTIPQGNVGYGPSYIPNLFPRAT